jgi:hypothetical protein
MYCQGGDTEGAPSLQHELGEVTETSHLPSEGTFFSLGSLVDTCTLPFQVTHTSNLTGCFCRFLFLHVSWSFLLSVALVISAQSHPDTDMWLLYLHSVCNQPVPRNNHGTICFHCLSMKPLADKGHASIGAVTVCFRPGLAYMGPEFPHTFSSSCYQLLAGLCNPEMKGIYTFKTSNCLQTTHHLTNKKTLVIYVLHFLHLRFPYVLLQSTTSQGNLRLHVSKTFIT